MKPDKKLKPKSYDFKARYAALKELYPRLIPVDHGMADRMQAELLRDSRWQATVVHLFSICFAILITIILGFLIYKIYLPNLEALLPVIDNFLQSISQNDIEIYNPLFGAMVIVILLFFIVIPVCLKLLRLFPKLKLTVKLNHTVFGHIDRSYSSYIIVALCLLYMALGMTGFLILLNYWPAEEFLAFFVETFSFVPVAVVTMMLIGLFLFLIVFPIMNHWLNFRYSRDKRLEILITLFDILEKLASVKNSFYMDHKNLKYLNRKLDTIKRLIASFPEEVTVACPVCVRDDYRKAAAQFGTLIPLLCGNPECRSGDFETRVVDYTNLFLEGNLAELPKAEQEEPYVAQRRAKWMQYLQFGICLVTPVIVVVLLNLVFHIAIDEYTKSLIKILYIIWVAVVVLSSSVILNEENKDFIKDMFRTIFMRG